MDIQAFFQFIIDNWITFAVIAGIGLLYFWSYRQEQYNLEQEEKWLMDNPIGVGWRVVQGGGKLNEYVSDFRLIQAPYRWFIYAQPLLVVDINNTTKAWFIRTRTFHRIILIIRQLSIIYPHILIRNRESISFYNYILSGGMQSQQLNNKKYPNISSKWSINLWHDNSKASDIINNLGELNCLIDSVYAIEMNGNSLLIVAKESAGRHEHALSKFAQSINPFLESIGINNVFVKAHN